MSELHISTTLSLPIDAATGTFGILATKGAGKSNAAVVMAEEMFDAGIPWVAVDPKGDWWGIRSSGDGGHPGLPVVVFGGRHGDVPLEPNSGHLIADLAVGQLLTCVLDVSEFTKAETIRFLHDFGARLFRAAEGEPIHLFLEEAHEYLPQQVRNDQATMVSTWQRIVKQGRFKGLGCTLISQRSASLNKDVLELVDTLIVMRTMGPRSRDAVKAWVVDQDVDSGLMASLPTLDDGEAWVWSPGALKIMERIQFRRRRTFDSGATPKIGEKRRQPSTLADVDLGAIKEQMADAIERAEATDPKVLQRRLREAEERVRFLEQQPVKEVAKEVPYVPEIVASLANELDVALEQVANVRRRLGNAVENLGTRPEESRAIARNTARPEPAPKPVTRPDAPRPAAPARGIPRDRAELPGPWRKLLIVLATHGPRTKRQLAMQSGYVMSGGAFRNPLGALRSNGYVTTGEPIAITAEGLAALGDFEPLPTGQALIDHWMSGLSGPERRILQPVIDAWPNAMSRNDLAAAAGYEPTGGAFRNPLGKLRTLELLTRSEPITLTDDFAAAIH